MTQEDVAARVKIHLTTYGRIERGESNSPIHTLEKIAHALGVNIDKFF
jgi:transcriptional regulator with XRE-family HTH domain